MRSLEAYIHAAAGHRDDALRLLRQTEAEPDRPRAGEMDLAGTYDLLGMPARAQAAVERALRNPDSALVFAAVEPRWDRLRAIRPFAAFVSTMKLSTGEH